MNKNKNDLLEAAIELAVKKEFERFIDVDIKETELPPNLEKRVQRILRKMNLVRFCRDHVKSAAACFCVMIAGIGIGFPLCADANAPDCYMLTDQDIYSKNISIQFLCQNGDTASEKVLTPQTAAEVLEGFELIRTYSTDSVYIEEYGGLRYEQTLLRAEGRYIFPTANQNIRNIIIGDYVAVLMFDAEHAAIVWRDKEYSYMLEGDLSSDDAMRYARLLSE